MITSRSSTPRTVSGAARFEGAAWQHLEPGARVLIGAIVGLGCEVEDILPRHGQMLVLARVRTIAPSPGQRAPLQQLLNREICTERPIPVPLMYHQARRVTPTLLRMPNDRLDHRTIKRARNSRPKNATHIRSLLSLGRLHDDSRNQSSHQQTIQNNIRFGLARCGAQSEMCTKQVIDRVSPPPPTRQR